MHTRYTTCILLIALLGWIAPAEGGVITDPTVFTGPDAIDPAGSETVTDNELGGAASQATLEARPDFGAVHDWVGFTGWNQNPANTNVLNFTNSTRPDVEFRIDNISGTTIQNNYGANRSSTTGNWQTSGESHISLSQGGAEPFTGTHTVTISFGDYSSGSFVNNQAVEAAGFTISNINGGTNTSNSTRYQADFQNAAGDTLFLSDWVDDFSHQGDSVDGRPNVFFAHSTLPGALLEDRIARIILTEERRGGQGSANLMGFDDLGFTDEFIATAVIPEPSTLLLLTPLAALLLVWRRRQGA